MDTYAYFGEPVYIYSLKEGINDGFLTSFKVKQIFTTIDYYTYTSDDTVVEGEIASTANSGSFWILCYPTTSAWGWRNWIRGN